MVKSSTTLWERRKRLGSYPREGRIPELGGLGLMLTGHVTWPLSAGAEEMTPSWAGGELDRPCHRQTWHWTAMLDLVLALLPLLLAIL